MLSKIGNEQFFYYLILCLPFLGARFTRFNSGVRWTTIAILASYLRVDQPGTYTFYFKFNLRWIITFEAQNLILVAGQFIKVEKEIKKHISKRSHTMNTRFPTCNWQKIITYFTKVFIISLSKLYGFWKLFVEDLYLCSEEFNFVPKGTITGRNNSRKYSPVFFTQSTLNRHRSRIFR